MIETAKWAMKIMVGATMGAAAVGLVVWAVSLSRINTQQIASRAASRLDSERLASLRASLEWEAEQSFGPARSFYGYYGDLNKEGNKTDVSKETYKLRFAKTSDHVKGELSGMVEVAGKPVLRRWIIEGFHREPRMVLNFSAFRPKRIRTRRELEPTIWSRTAPITQERPCISIAPMRLSNVRMA